MKTRYVSALTAVLLIALAGLMPFNSAGLSLVGFSVHTPGEPPMVDGNGTYHMTAGIWTVLEITLDSPADELTVEMRYTGAQGENWSTYYMWRNSAGSWSDPVYGHYISPENCSADGSTYLFYVGVSYGVYYGNWMLDISSGGSSVASRPVVVDEPKVAASFHSADFNLWGEPFVATTLDSEESMQYFRIVNEGNVPLEYTVNYSAYANRINTTGAHTVIPPGGEARHYLLFRTDAWSPRILSFSGVITATAAYRVPQRENTTHLIPSVASTFTGKVYIGHTSYEIYTDGDLSFQAKKRISADYNSISNLTVFITGNGTATIGVKSSDCSIRSVLYGGRNVTLPLQIELVPDAERNITVTVLADSPETTAAVYYEISYKGDYHKYTTEIAVGPMPQSVDSDETAPVNDSRLAVVAFILILVGGAVAYMVFTQKRLAEEARLREEQAGKKAARRKRK